MRGLYIHVPYCQMRCHYCAFYSKTRFDTNEPELFARSVVAELSTLANTNFQTVYIGGGTPTIMGNGLVKLIQQVANTIQLPQVAEFTIEANPESLTTDLLHNLKHYTPVNRISIGAQSFDDKTLKFLNRPHSAKVATQRIEKSLKLGFNTGADIIFDIPTVPTSNTLNDISTLVKLGVNHISAYSYTPDTNFLKDKVNPDNTIFDQVANEITKHGYKHYEVSNFAQKGCESKHNGIYWNMNEYMGLGPSAHSMFYNDKGERIRYKNVSNTKLYCQNYEKYRQYTTLTTHQQLMESFVFPLRTGRGVDVANVLNRMPIAWQQDRKNNQGNRNEQPRLKILQGLPDELQKRVVHLLGKQLLHETPVGVATTPKGLMLLDSVMEYLYY